MPRLGLGSDGIIFTLLFTYTNNPNATNSPGFVRVVRARVCCSSDYRDREGDDELREGEGGNRREERDGRWKRGLRARGGGSWEEAVDEISMVSSSKQYISKKFPLPPY